MTDHPALTPGALPAPPATPEAAAERLASLKADEGWRAAFLSGSGPHVKEYRDLNELATRAHANNEVEAAMSGRLEPEIQPTGRLQNIGLVEMLRSLEIRDDVIRQTLTDQQVTQAEFDAVKRWKADHMRDKEWTAKYLGGDLEAQRQMMLANIVLTSTIRKQEKAA